jgi:hypothetical protein
MRHAWYALLLGWQLRRARRRYLRRWVRYGPGCGLSPDEIRSIYADAGDTFFRAVTGGNHWPEVHAQVNGATPSIGRMKKS